MNFEVKSTVTLSDDKKYMVMSKVEYNGKKYMFLINIDDEKDYKFCSLNNENKLFQIKDEDLIHTIAPLLYKNLLEEIEKV
ncbi:MAG: hypothetical protein GX032_01215 [Tenericutes bacterium]|nr:hypothetical protein [Bacilli bacterium]MDD4831953.1 hypothetical protein [Bacilli bacterium]NLV90079.1 hypothetical protein [Mycoplasmatota bacterium]